MTWTKIRPTESGLYIVAFPDNGDFEYDLRWLGPPAVGEQWSTDTRFLKIESPLFPK